MASLALIRTAGGLVPATEADREALQGIKLGRVLHGQFQQMRNPQFHRKFFALLDLAFDYWEPVGGLISRQERMGIEGFARFLEAHTGSTGGATTAARHYIDKLERERAERFPAADKSREAFREWVTIEAGHYDIVSSPAGMKRKAKSISWPSMDDTAFGALYKDAFSVCWRLVLSSHFESEEAAMAAADQMGSFA